MKPHPFKQLFPGHPHCIEGLIALQSGISCGKLSSDPIHSVPPSAATVAMVDRLEAERVAELTPTEARHELNRELGAAFDTLAASAERLLRRPGREYQGKIESLTARMAAALVLLRHLRAEVSVVTVVPGHDDRSRFRENIDKITETLTLPTETEHDRIRKEAFAAVRVSANAPAEARPGISDRTAAALTDVAEIGRVLYASGVDPAWFEPLLSRIEQALHAGGAA